MSFQTAIHEAKAAILRQYSDFFALSMVNLANEIYGAIDYLPVKVYSDAEAEAQADETTQMPTEEAERPD